MCGDFQKSMYISGQGDSADPISTLNKMCNFCHFRKCWAVQGEFQLKPESHYILGASMQSEVSWLSNLFLCVLPASHLIWPAWLAGPVWPVQPEKPPTHSIAVTPGAMRRVHDFAVDLTKAGRSFKIKAMVAPSTVKRASRKQQSMPFWRKSKRGKVVTIIGASRWKNRAALLTWLPMNPPPLRLITE